MEKEKTITLSLSIVYYSVSLIPLSLIIVCVIIFYSYGHEKIYPYIPTLSEMMVQFPEMRLFSVSMSIEAALIFIFGIVHSRMFSFYYSISKKKHPIIAKSLHFVADLLIFVSSIGMIIFGNCPVKFFHHVHNYSAGTFFVSILFHFTIGDIYFWIFNSRPKWISLFATAMCYASIVLNPIIRNTVSSKNHPTTWTKWYGVSSFGEFGAIFFLFIKIIILSFQYPKQLITIVNRSP